jgi:DNA-binding MarR family transcriptional regulator
MKWNRGLAVLTWLRLIRVAQKVGLAGAEHIEKHGLSGGMFDVLAEIGTDEGLTQQELADHLLVTKGNVSQLLAKLETQGLVEKRQEGRAKYIYLTPEGRALLEEIMPQHDAFINQRMGHLNEAELQELHAILRKLDKRLG